MSQKIVCFGEALIDMLAQPWPDNNATHAFVPYAGGAPANVAVAVAKLGGEAWFAGMLGADMFGDFLYQSFQQIGVNTNTIVRTDKAKTALAFVALDEQGERSFSFYRPPAADLLFGPEHFHENCFTNTGAFHVCSNSLTEEGIRQTVLYGMQRARDNGAVVAMDMNFRLNLWPQGANPLPFIWQALSLADLVKLSREELEYLAQSYGGGETGAEKVRQKLLENKTQLLIITDGANPIHWYTSNQKLKGMVTSFSVKAQDTTGAGDAFVGGLLFRIGQLSGLGQGFSLFCENIKSITDAVKFGAATGALAVTRKGSFAAMPSLAEVENVLQENNLS